MTSTDDILTDNLTEGGEVIPIHNYKINTRLPKSQTIIVSSFISYVNQREDRNLTKYIEFGKKLICANIPKIIFIEKEIYHDYLLKSDLFQESETHLYHKKIMVEIDYTKLYLGGLPPIQENYKQKIEKEMECVFSEEHQCIFVFFEKADMYFYEEGLDLLISQFSVDTPNPSKDTPEYMFVQNHKPEWIRLAIHLLESLEKSGYGRNAPISFSGCDLGNRMVDGLSNHQYIWMDFGIFHMFQRDENYFHFLMNQLSYRLEERFVAACANGYTFQSVYFSSCWNPHLEYALDIYKQIHWVFAGSIFGGFREALLSFADYCRVECSRIVRQKQTLMWEVNVWHIIQKHHPELFGFYHCNHDKSILENY